jgi:hypothetical protein
MNVVYERTPDGQWAAYNAESPLPRKLRILLKTINGRVTEDEYARSLSAFGDVRELLRSLAQSGLIVDTAKRDLHGAAASANAAAAAIAPPVALKLVPRPAAAPAGVPGSATDPAMADWVLRLAIENMCGFVLAHLPEGAFTVLPEIEALTTLGQLAALMDGYAQFVAAAGAPGVAHLAEIKQLLEAGGSARPATGTEHYA